MDRYEKSLREKRSHCSTLKSPSFSSTLLDAIYRSIDDDEEIVSHHHQNQSFRQQQEEELILYRETTRKKQNRDQFSIQKREEIRSCRIEKWMETGLTVGPSIRRSDFAFFNSTSSSSDSSCGGFSSSETESVYRPKPIRTTIEKSQPLISKKTQFPTPPKKEGFIKSKSRAASKIYGELKKARQPISPGGRLASFLNSIFAAGHTKKAKITSLSRMDGRDLKSKSAPASSSTCSSASSYSRSCLSKTPSSRGGRSSINGAKRTVRFYPVSVIFDEYCRPYGQKRLYEDDPNLTAFDAIRTVGQSPIGGDNIKYHAMERNKRVEEAAKEMLKEYQKKRELLEEVIRTVHHGQDDQDDDNNGDDCDTESYSSSDLFELENLATIGIERYREELPVYETTYLDTNRAITKALIL